MSFVIVLLRSKIVFKENKVLQNTYLAGISSHLLMTTMIFTRFNTCTKTIIE